ncbi:hypothetical protein [Planctomicrobium sp. SH664]|uniref:hypothetical protein n=1 Tax=Planctomicrobium sp. SH664 TaxID=3448125 RepID=UPI003F5B3C4C
MIRFLLCGMSRLIMAVLLLGLGVCALEVGLRAWQLRQRIAATTANESIELTVPSASSWIDVKPLVQIQRAAENGETIRIRTNEAGLRGPSVVVPKPRGVFRILVLGGDSVFGSETDNDHTVPARLSHHLSRNSSQAFDVVNAGCPGAGPLINLLRFRHQLATTQPDLVLLCLAQSDLMSDQPCRGALRLDDARQPAYAAHPRLSAQGYDIPDAVCCEFLTVDYLTRKLGSVAGFDRAAVPRPISSRSPASLAPVVPLQQLVTASFGQLLISIAPSNSLLGAEPQKQPSDLEADLKALLQKTELDQLIPVQNALSDFLSTSDPRSLFYNDSGKLNARGNDLYAQSLARFVLQAMQGPPATLAQPPAQVPSGNSGVPAPIPFSAPAPSDPWPANASPQLLNRQSR